MTETGDSSFWGDLVNLWSVRSGVPYNKPRKLTLRRPSPPAAVVVHRRRRPDSGRGVLQLQPLSGGGGNSGYISRRTNRYHNGRRW